MNGALLIATGAVPLAMLAACLAARVRRRMYAWLWLAPLPGLAAALVTGDAPPLVLDAERLRLTLALEPAGATLLGVAALLWTLAGAYARTWLRGAENAGQFAAWWLLTLAGSLSVFLAADLFTFYAAYAVVSLAAWGLVVHDETASARRAGAIYVGLAVVGEICLLVAFAQLAVAAPGDSLAIRDVVAALPAASNRSVTIALLLLGFGLKIGLVPLHVWMPLSYAAAPHPAAAVMSGAAVKAGVIGLIQFLPFGTALPWGSALAAIGFASAFYGAAIGVRQRDPKAILAYSSVSQMGGIAAVLGMGLASIDAGAVSAASFVAAHHVLVKGALFLSLGVIAAGGARRKPLVFAPMLVLSLALAGLPLTGGALAKLAAKSPLGDGLVGALAPWTAAATAMLMLHFVRRAAALARDGSPRAAEPGLVAWWLASAAAALIVPWWLAPRVLSDPFREAIDASNLGGALWPIAVGALAAVVLGRVERYVPLPEGDRIVAGARIERLARRGSEYLEKADLRIEEWPVASLALLGIAITLGAALVLGR